MTASSLFGNIANETSNTGGTLPFLTGGTAGRPNEYLLDVHLGKVFRSTQKNKDYCVLEFTVVEVLADGGSEVGDRNASQADIKAAAPATRVGTRCNQLMDMSQRSTMGDIKAAVSAILGVEPDTIDTGMMETAFAIYDANGKMVNAANADRKVRDADGNEYEVVYEESLLQQRVICRVHEKVQRGDKSKTYTKHTFSAAE
jgi:hypothetical protein